jgi:hypothetical protein
VAGDGDEEEVCGWIEKGSSRPETRKGAARAGHESSEGCGGNGRSGRDDAAPSNQIKSNITVTRQAPPRPERSRGPLETEVTSISSASPAKRGKEGGMAPMRTGSAEASLLLASGPPQAEGEGLGYGEELSLIDGEMEELQRSLERAAQWLS